MKVKEELKSRWVTGMPAYAGAAMAAVMPGTTSKRTPAAREGLALFAAAAEDEGVAALEADDAPAGAAPCSTSSALICSWVIEWAGGLLADVDRARRWGSGTRSCGLER